jgi:hypothetical protein
MRRSRGSGPCGERGTRSLDAGGVQSVTGSAEFVSASSVPGRLLFLLRAQPDVDHITPLIWKCLEKGEQVRIIFDRPFPRDDFRLRFLGRWPAFETVTLAGVQSRNRLVALGARRQWGPARFRRLLQAHQISACFFDWFAGSSHPTPAKRLAHLGRQVRNVGLFWPSARDFRNVWKRDVLNRLFPPIRNSLATAVHQLGIPAFCLPHGMHMFFNADTTPRAVERLHRYRGRLPDEHAVRFRAYVVNTDNLRELRLSHYGDDPEIVQNWGSLRFSPQWRRVLVDICPPADLPPRRPGQTRVVFLLPKWVHFVDKSETLALLRSVAEREDVQLLIKAHPRPGQADLDAETVHALAGRPNVVFAGNAESQALINAADLGIVIISSLVVELFLQRKPIVYPKYLHPHRMTFEERPGCLTAQSRDEVHQWLDRFRLGTTPGIDSTEVTAVEREFVYAGRPPYDVPEYYYERVRAYLDNTTGNRLTTQGTGARQG